MADDDLSDILYEYLYLHLPACLTKYIDSNWCYELQYQVQMPNSYFIGNMWLFP